MPNHRFAIAALSLLAATPVPLFSAHASSEPSERYADFLDARFAASQGDLRNAAQWYLRALAASPDDVGLRRQAFLETALGGREEATGLARSLPHDALAQLWLIGVEARAGNWTAMSASARALPDGPLSTVMRPLLLAWALQARGETDAALATLNPLAQNAESGGVFALHAGLIADLAGRKRAARGYMARAREDFSTPSLRVAQILSSFQVRNAERGTAMGLLAHFSAGEPELALAIPAMEADAGRDVISSSRQGIAEAFLAAAGTLGTQGKASHEAMLMLDVALNLRPRLGAARLLAASLDEQDGRNTAAEQALDSIASDDPLAPIAALHRARLMAANGETQAALNTLDTLAKTCPQSSLPLSAAGSILRAGGEFSAAIAEYDRAIERDGANWTLFYARGVARDEAHDANGAKADMEHALRLAPSQPAILNYLGYSWADRDQNLTQARQMIDDAVRLDPGNGAYLDSLGWVMLRQGDLGGAIENLERASELMPDDATVTGHLGDAYAAAGRRLEAGYEWRRALMLNPEAHEAARLKAKLDVSPSQSASAEVSR